MVVEDRGPGVPTSQRTTIFEPFFQASGAPRGGTGLGLAISREIVEGHGGSIRADSRVGGGARIVVSVPSDPEFSRGD